MHPRSVRQRKREACRKAVSRHPPLQGSAAAVQTLAVHNNGRHGSLSETLLLKPYVQSYVKSYVLSILSWWKFLNRDLYSTPEVFDRLNIDQLISFTL